MIAILTLILFTLGAIIAAAVTDFKNLRIPNIIPMIVCIAFFVTWGAATMLGIQIFTQPLMTHLTVGILSLCLMVALFFMKIFGGGDAKLIPAVALWVGLSGLPVFLMVTSVMGGILAIISLAMRKTRLGVSITTKAASLPMMQDGWVAAMARGGSEVPYGIAIAIGAMVAFRSSGLLP